MECISATTQAKLKKKKKLGEHLLHFTCHFYKIDPLNWPLLVEFEDLIFTVWTCFFLLPVSFD